MFTANAKRAIERLSRRRFGRAKETVVRLQRWSRQRRIIVLRRRARGALGLALDGGGRAALPRIP